MCKKHLDRGREGTYVQYIELAERKLVSTTTLNLSGYWPVLCTVHRYLLYLDPSVSYTYYSTTNNKFKTILQRKFGGVTVGITPFPTGT